MWNDVTRGLLMATLISGLSLGIKLGYIDWDADQFADVQLFLGNLVILLFYLFKKGQGDSGPV